MKKLLRILGAAALGAACTSVVRAGDQTFDMDSDPAGVPGFLIAGPNFANHWQPTDGNPATGGWLQIAPAAGSSGLLFVFPDVDLYTNSDGTTTSLPIKAFTIDMDLRVGNGTTERPADGFSISFVRPNDALLTDAANNNGTATGSGNFAGGDTAPSKNTPPFSDDVPDGSGDAENGAKTGLVLGFDAWEGNWVPAKGTASTNYNGGSNDREGLRVAVDEVSYVQYFFYTNGVQDRNGACDDYNSAQTGPWTGGDGSYAGLCWQPLHVELDTNKQVTVIWKNHVILDHYQLTNYPTSQARLVIAGRTGGNNQNIGVDNIHIVTVPSVQATFVGVTPAGNAGLFGFVASYTGVGPAIVTNISTATLDGTDVTGSLVLSTTGQNTTATYLQANRLAGGNHTVYLIAKDALGNVLTNTATLATPSYFVFPTNNVMALSAADTTKPGFVVKSYQSPWWQRTPNNSQWTEEQFEGLKGPNYADQSAAVNGEFTWTGGLDFSGSNPDGTATDPGFMSYLSGKGYDTPLNTFGIGGASAQTNSYNANIGGSNPDDNCALEFDAYVYFPTSGVYNAYLGSDDGFRFTTSGNSRDHIGTTVMEFSGGRGIGTGTGNASHLAWVIQQPGLYPIRLLWENGTGGRAVEWYFDYGAGNYILANDDGSITGLISPVKAYRAVSSGAAPYVKFADPVMNSANIPLDQSIIVDLADGSSPVNTNTVALALDGAARPVAITQPTAGVTHIVYTPSSLWAQGASHTVTLMAQDGTGKGYTNQWTFTAEIWSTPITMIPASWGIPTSQVDHSKPGFLIRSYQTTAGNNNTVLWTEQQLMGQHGANIAVQTNGNPNGYYVQTDVIDYSGLSGAGASTAVFPYNYDLGLIGMVPNSGANEPNNSTAEIAAWIEFPSAGIYTMSVNSDDGFKVTTSKKKDIHDAFGQVLGWYNGGRGSSGTPGNGTHFDFYVAAPGAYPFRLLWENGGGGAGVEWTIRQHLPDGSYQDLLVNESHVPGDIKAYQAALTEPAHMLGIYPSTDYANRPSENHTTSRSQTYVFALQSGSAPLNTGSVNVSVGGVNMAASVTSAGSNNIWLVTVAPDAANPATWWPSGADMLKLTYADANGSYTNSIEIDTEFYGTVAGGYPLGSGDANKRGFLMRTYQVDQQGGQAIANRLPVAEQVLAGLYGPSVINVYSNNVFGMTNGYWVLNGTGPTNGVINFDYAGPDGDFQPNNGYPEQRWPGIPGIGTGAAGGHHTDSFAAEILTYVEFPTNGTYIMGFNSDDGFRVTRGWAAPNDNGSLIVQGPAGVSGVIPTAPWGYQSTREIINPISGKVVQALGIGGGTENGTRPGVSKEGCPPLVNAADLAGNIALIYRGTCNFNEKIQAAKDAGAIGVIFVQNRPKFSSGDGWFPPEFTIDPQIDIPVMSIPQTNGDLLASVLATNGEIMATITAFDFQANPPPGQSPLGQADYGKGASDVTFAVTVPQAGVYPLRTVYWQGGGGANGEWFSMVGTNKVLLNDDSSTNGPALKAYYGLTVRPAVNLSVSGSAITINYTGTLQMSRDLKQWVDVYGQPPYVTSTSAAGAFFRAR